MSPGSVLVIDDDEWVGRLLGVALREAGYEVHISVSAVEGYEKAVEVVPDCIICDVDLPDVDGFWVARKIRMSTDKVSITPILFLSGLDDRDTRLQGFHVGADVYMTKPFRIDEVVAQVGALVQMASRLRQSRKTFLSIPPTEAAMQGDLAQMSVATVLTLLDMERRSGKLEVQSKEQKAVLAIVSGAITSASLGGETRDPLELLRTILTWHAGRFAFHPDTSDAAPPPEASINALLMEAVRLEDEQRESAEGQKVDSSRRSPSSRMPRFVQSKPPGEAPPTPVAVSQASEVDKGWSEPPPAPRPTPPPATPLPPTTPPKTPPPQSPKLPPPIAAVKSPPKPPLKPSPVKPGLVPPTAAGAPAKAPFKPFGTRTPVPSPPVVPVKAPAETPSPAPPETGDSVSSTAKTRPLSPFKPPPPAAPQTHPAPVRAVPPPPNPRVGQGSGDK